MNINFCFTLVGNNQCH